MGQQDGHVDDVEVGQEVAAAAGQAVRQAAHQVAGVVEVAGHAPEAGHQQLAVVLLLIGRREGTLDDLGLPAPDQAAPVRAAEEVLLMVGHPEDVVAQQAQQQDAQGVAGGQLHGVVHQVQTLQGERERSAG